VLSLPPAFNLSHDQTLQFKKFNRSICTDYKKSLNMNFKLSTYQDFKIKKIFLNKVNQQVPTQIV
ncbi:hypothetical protein Q7371_04235, partial [Glaesserella parasuis]|nr:hypothetical protein [Glaesserella parasuis]MDO9810595.1 hypothetical protein [Glaesserella parasuis]MDO9848348.1 hypothetical protein [Glaesserella parasuis]MDO9897380.1 hypothetical protein [Glaesserella parasuis]MDO9935290.1 hypothetical protein [Glaesserella parasuis]